MSANKLLWFKLVNEDEIVNPCSSFKKIGVSNVSVDGHKGGLPFLLLVPWTYNLFRLRLALWRCSGEPHQNRLQWSFSSKKFALRPSSTNKKKWHKKRNFVTCPKFEIRFLCETGLFQIHRSPINLTYGRNWYIGSTVASKFWSRVKVD